MPGDARPADTLLKGWITFIVILIIAVVVGAFFAFATDEAARGRPGATSALIERSPDSPVV
jgi:hypothetical protein